MKALKNILIQNGNSKVMKFLAENEISYLESEGSHTKIYTANSSCYLSLKKIKDIESILPQDIFYRVHNSFIINIDHIACCNLSDENYIKLQSGISIPISRRKKSRFLNFFQKL